MGNKKLATEASFGVTRLRDGSKLIVSINIGANNNVATSLVIKCFACSITFSVVRGHVSYANWQQVIVAPIITCH